MANSLLDTPDEFVELFPASTGVVGKGPFREVQVLVDNQLAGVVWPYAVIYTGGITPSNWRPLTSYGAYDAPTYWVDITPFLPVLLVHGTQHNVTLRVSGQGTSPSFNFNWFLSGSVHVRTGSTDTTGRMTRYQVGNLQTQTAGGSSSLNGTVWTRVTASRDVRVESELITSEGKKVVEFSQSLSYENEATYEDDGWVQVGIFGLTQGLRAQQFCLQYVKQTTTGTTTSTHSGKQVLRDAFAYPISVFSNYSLYTAEFGKWSSVEVDPR